MTLSSFRNDAYLLVNGEKIPVCIETIRQSWDTYPEFEGHFLEISPLLTQKTQNQYDDRMRIKKVIFNDPATIVLWKDGTKTVVKCQPGDIYSEEYGLALCIAKKALGNQSNFNNVFKKWIPEEKTIYTATNIDTELFTGVDTKAAADSINKFYNRMKKVFGGENA